MGQLAPTQSGQLDIPQSVHFGAIRTYTSWLLDLPKTDRPGPNNNGVESNTFLFATNQPRESKLDGVSASAAHPRSDPNGWLQADCRMCPRGIAFEGTAQHTCILIFWSNTVEWFLVCSIEATAHLLQVNILFFLQCSAEKQNRKSKSNSLGLALTNYFWLLNK